MDPNTLSGGPLTPANTIEWYWAPSGETLACQIGSDNVRINCTLDGVPISAEDYLTATDAIDRGTPRSEWQVSWGKSDPCSLAPR